MRVQKPIGGEPWFDVGLFDRSRDNFRDAACTFLDGGQSALNFIVQSLDFKDGESILLPAYLCPSIVRNIRRNGVRFRFYAIRPDLSIDTEDLERQILRCRAKAVLFIDYFGFRPDARTAGFLLGLQSGGISLVEDAVQMLWFNPEGFLGDYVFNSYRKFLPVDGSIVLGPEPRSFEAAQDAYYEYMNLARMKLTAYVKYGIGSIEEFTELFSKAEESYGKSTEIHGMSDISRYLLDRTDAVYIGNARRRNFEYLSDALAGSVNIRPLIPKSRLAETVPLGLPVVIDNRDIVRRKLREAAIYCPVHWPILGEDWVQGYPDSVRLAEHILMLPIDQRYGEDDMDRLLGELEKRTG